MGRWDAISDQSNPFNQEGLSDEVEAMLDYLVSAKMYTGIDVVATSTTDHPVKSASGSTSRHRQAGTNGEGLGLDCRLRRRGNDIHLPVWKLWLSVAEKCHELIYALGVDHQGRARNIKNEAWTSRYAVNDHHDHVHISVDRGVFLKYPFEIQNGSNGEDEMKPRVVRNTATGECFVWNGSFLVRANEEAHREIVRFYAGQSEHWDNWDPKYIAAVPIMDLPGAD